MGKTKEALQGPVLALPPARPEQSRLVLESLVLRQRHFEQSVYGDAHTGNDVLRHAVDNGTQNIIYDKDSMPEVTNPNWELLNTYDNAHSRAIRKLFIESVQDPSEREKVRKRFEEKGRNLGQNLPLVYGTSGTETNPKEIGNTLGAVATLESVGQQALGVYFVEDEGHPMHDTIANETEAYAHYVAAKKGIGIQEARRVTSNAFTNLYGNSSRDIYDPESPEIQNLLTYVDPAQKEKVGEYFNTCNAVLQKAKPEDQLNCNAANVNPPSPEKVAKTYSELEFPEEVTELFTKAAQLIKDNPDQFPNATIADYRTIVQGVIGLKFAYYAHGADKMPVWAIDKWSNICKKTGVSDAITVGSAKERLNSHYPDKKRRVLNFACPCCKGEHWIDADGNGTTKTKCGFESISGSLDNVPLSAWKWGGNSGVMYYEAFIDISKNGLLAVFMDNYEANGPQSRLVEMYEKGKQQDQNLFLYPPETRTWVVGPNIPYKENGRNKTQPTLSDIVDANSVLGASPPSEVVLAYTESLGDDSKKKMARSWFEMSGQCGVDNNCGVLRLDIGGAELQRLPYDLLRNWEYVSANVAVDHAIGEKTSQAGAILHDARANHNGGMFSGLVDGRAGESIAQTAQHIQAQHEKVVGSIETINRLIAAGKVHENELVREMGRVNDLGEQISVMRREAAIQLIYHEKDRLLERGIQANPSKPAQVETAQRLQQALEQDDKGLISADRDLVTKMKAEVCDMRADDELAKPDNTKTKGELKKAQERSLESEIDSQLQGNVAYRETQMRLVLLREEIDWHNKRTAHKQIQDKNKHFEKDVLPRLLEEQARLEAQRKMLVWDVLSSLAVSSRTRV